MLRRLLFIITFIGLLGIAANDVSRIATAYKELRGVTYDVTRWAAENAATMSRDQAAARILADAQAQGVTLYAYDQTDKAVRVYTSAEVRGTIIAGPIYNMVEGATLEEAYDRPLTIRDHRDAGFVR